MVSFEVKPICLPFKTQKCIISSSHGVSSIPLNPMFSPLKNPYRIVFPSGIMSVINTDTIQIETCCCIVPLVCHLIEQPLRGRRTLTSSTTEAQSHLLMGPLSCWETKKDHNTGEQRVMGCTRANSMAQYTLCRVARIHYC